MINFHHAAGVDDEPPTMLTAGAQTARHRKRQQAYEWSPTAICQPFVGQAVLQRVVCWVPADNNAAGRGIRLVVVRHEICGGSRSSAGTWSRTTLRSLIDTWPTHGQPRLSAWAAMLRYTAGAAR